METVCSDLHPLKARPPISVTELGMSMVVVDSSFISKRMVPVSSRIRFGSVMVVRVLACVKIVQVGRIVGRLAWALCRVVANLGQR